MLAGRDVYRDFLAPHQVVGQTHIVKVVHFDHQMVEALSRRSQPESNCVVALIAMHEDRRDGLLAHSDFVLHAAAHPEQGIKSISSVGVLLADNAMSES